VQGKTFSARGIFARPLEVHAGSRTRQIGSLFSARLLPRLLEISRPECGRGEAEQAQLYNK
jgi:hypothetical protein